MNFRTILSIPSQTTNLSYKDKLMLLGSCFTENIGEKLEKFHLPQLTNPFGILYNPISIAQSIERLMENKPFDENELFEHNGLIHSWAHHGSFSAPSEKQALTNMNKLYLEAAEHFKETTVLLITFGSSWIYEYEGNVVANCHKVPEREFIRRRLSVDEIVTRYSDLLAKISAQNPTIHVIFSVSPIRYMRQGATENQTNKAILLLAVEELTKRFEQVNYFPAYEILLDELRDYRFFSDDMIHPSTSAIDYIWERFVETYFDRETQELLPQLEKLNKNLEHRPLHQDSKAYQIFNKTLDSQVLELKKRYPTLIFKKNEGK